jgi:hypothetical protein
MPEGKILLRSVAVERGHAGGAAVDRELRHLRQHIDARRIEHPPRIVAVTQTGRRIDEIDAGRFERCERLAIADGVALNAAKARLALHEFGADLGEVRLGSWANVFVRCEAVFVRETDRQVFGVCWEDWACGPAANGASDVRAGRRVVFRSTPA